MHIDNRYGFSISIGNTTQYESSYLAICTGGYTMKQSTACHWNRPWTVSQSRYTQQQSKNGQTPSIIGICLYCVLDRPVFGRCQTLLHPEQIFGYQIWFCNRLNNRDLNLLGPPVAIPRALQGQPSLASPSGNPSLQHVSGTVSVLSSNQNEAYIGCRLKSETPILHN